ncbi:hypothetical protein AGOR_G00171970 [Albula goreensis]|uniref:Uncharacterized protein n=1 Tax=Albula goreensis TaxID=1534307 RepID=A0A8T3CU42_9TELE|nr:hypothetical protein AGOR_G00171970 [Albula goreensis]
MSKMLSTASDVVDVAQVIAEEGDRCVTIHLNNHSNSHILVHPRFHTSSGFCSDPPQPTVQSGETVTCSFNKTAGAARGAVGVMTYDITNHSNKVFQRLAIMFSVPYDYNLYENYFAVGLFDSNRSCDYDLYSEMYYKDGLFTRQKASGGEISYKRDKYTVKGIMSDTKKAILRVEFWDLTE